MQGYYTEQDALVIQYTLHGITYPIFVIVLV